MSNKLFVGGLPWSTDDAELQQAFAPYGEVVDAKVVTDRETGRSRGFGFVTYASEAEATAARDAMDGASLGGRRLRVDLATERPRGDRPPRPGGGGGYGDRRPGGGGGGGYGDRKPRFGGGGGGDRGGYGGGGGGGDRGGGGGGGGGDRGGYGGDRGGYGGGGGGYGDRKPRFGGGPAPLPDHREGKPDADSRRKKKFDGGAGGGRRRRDDDDDFDY
ncbi:MAG: RNA-binding protein [Sandaracinus sp.]|nr:RNA-binding protein [Sandaracinus sp.]